MNICKCGCRKECKRKWIKGHHLIGKKQSILTINKRVEKLIGKKPSQYTKDLISKSLLGKLVGEKNGFYKRKHSEESKMKMKKTLSLINRSGKNNPRYGKKNSEWNKKRTSECNKGKKSSKETKRKISLKVKGENNPMYGKHHTQESKIKIALNKRPSHTKGKFSYKGLSFDSSWEVKYAKYLDSKGIPWIRNTKRIWLIDDKGVFSYTPDFIVDGKFIETKGWFGPRTMRIVNALPSAGVKVEFLGKKELMELGINLKSKILFNQYL